MLCHMSGCCNNTPQTLGVSSKPELPILRYFAYDHLPTGELRDLSRKFHDMAHELADRPGMATPELVAGLRKLLEAKDCAVRAALPPLAAEASA